MLVLLAAPALAAGPARADERFALKWKAPEGCPDTGAVEAEVVRLLGGSRARPARTIDVSAAVSRDDRGSWRVRLETPGDGGPRVRQLTGASCKALADATALILALMIDPDAVTAAPPASITTPPPSTATPSLPAPSVPPSTPPLPPSESVESSVPSGGPSPAVTTSPAAAASPTGTPSPAPVAPLAAAAPSPAPPPFPPARSAPTRSLVSPPPAPPTDVSFHLGAWVGADAGTLPGVSAGFGASAALVIGPQRIEVGFAARPATRASLPQRPASGGDVDLIAGWAGTCRYLLRRPIALGPCVAVEVGRMRAAAFGVTTPGEAEEPWAAASAGGILVWSPLSRLGFVFRIDAAVPIVRHTFVIEGLGRVHEPSVVAARAAAGLELAF